MHCGTTLLMKEREKPGKFLLPHGIILLEFGPYRIFRFLATFREAMGFATNRPPEPLCQHRSDIVPQNGKTLHAVVF